MFKSYECGNNPKEVGGLKNQFFMFFADKLKTKDKTCC